VIDSILVPVDDTPDSERVIPVAVAIAKAMHADIEFLTVDSANVVRATMWGYHQGLIEALPAGVVGRGAVELSDAPVAEQLLDAYRLRPRSLLALATRAPGSLWQWLSGGSVGDDVVDETVRPVLLAGPQCVVDRPGDDHTIHATAALDGTDLDEQVAGAAVDWCRAVGSPLTFVRAVTTPAVPDAHRDAHVDLERRTAAARAAGVDAHATVVNAGEAGRAVLHLTTAGGILIVGSHRRRALGRAIHGSTALWLTHRSPVPVLVAGFTSTMAVANRGVGVVDLGSSQMMPSLSRTASELVGWSNLRTVAM
jgi:nucleotide-binding universal stress UspA family protein